MSDDFHRVNVRLPEIIAEIDQWNVTDFAKLYAMRVMAQLADYDRNITMRFSDSYGFCEFSAILEDGTLMLLTQYPGYVEYTATHKSGEVVLIDRVGDTSTAPAASA